MFRLSKYSSGQLACVRRGNYLRPHAAAALGFGQCRPNSTLAPSVSEAEGSVTPDAPDGSRNHFKIENDSVVFQFSSHKKPNTYSNLFLRDNCQCPDCVHPVTRQRLSKISEISGDVKAQSVAFYENGVVIDWSDGHLGQYSQSFLKAHVFNWSFQTRKPKFRPHKTYETGTFPRVNYDAVMENDQMLLSWLDKIHTWGFCFIEGVPINPKATEALLQRISFIRLTHYGGFWDFTADLTYKDTAYTTDSLDAHTDNTYFTDPSRLQLFHLLSHTNGSGGESFLVDGFRAAKHLLAENEEHHTTLTRHRIPWHASGNSDVVITPVLHMPVFTMHPTAQLLQIRWNNYDRAPKMNTDFQGEKDWFAAAQHWDQILRRPEMQIWSQLEPGKALIFDNWRMLHGRSQFTGKRRMCGGYINNDDFLSRYRLLKFGRESMLDHLGSLRASKKNPNLVF